MHTNLKKRIQLVKMYSLIASLTNIVFEFDFSSERNQIERTKLQISKINGPIKLKDAQKICDLCLRKNDISPCGELFLDHMFVILCV